MLILSALSNSTADAQPLDVIYVDTPDVTIRNEEGADFFSVNLSTAANLTEEEWFSRAVRIWIEEDDGSLRFEAFGKYILGKTVGERDLVLLVAEGQDIGSDNGNWIPSRECSGGNCHQPYFVAPDFFDWLGRTGYVGVELVINGRIHYAWVRLYVSDDGSTITFLDYAYIIRPEEPIKAGYHGNSAIGMTMDLETSTVCLSITNRSTVGYVYRSAYHDDYAHAPITIPDGCSPEVVGGSGIYFMGRQLLYEGGFLLATGPDKVRDNVRSNRPGIDVHYQGFDFVQKPSTELKVRIEGNSQTGLVQFVDTGTSSSIGVTVSQRTIVEDTPETEDFVIYEYVIRNDSNDMLENLYAGLFLDWDVEGRPSYRDNGFYDSRLKMGYVTSAASSTAPYVGVRLLTDTDNQSYHIINLSNEITGGGNPGYPGDGFTELEKWAMLNGQVRNKLARSADLGQLISSGPHSLSAGDSVRVPFGIVMGTDRNDLLANAVKVYDKYQSLDVFTKVTGPSLDAPDFFKVGSIFPHPIVAPTMLSYELSRPASVTLDIFDMLGRRLSTLLNTTQGPGSHMIIIEDSGLPDTGGLYMLRWRVQDVSNNIKYHAQIVVVL